MSGSLIDNPNAAWVVNGVNAVLQTDAVEGQAAGASHGGIGNSNAGAQALANRTAYLYGRQNTDIGNITMLQGQVASINARLVTGSAQASFYSNPNFTFGPGVGPTNLLTASISMPSTSPSNGWRIFCRGTLLCTINSGAGSSPWVARVPFEIIESLGGDDLLIGTGATTVVGGPTDTYTIAGGDFCTNIYSPSQQATFTLSVGAYGGTVTSLTINTVWLRFTAVPS